MQRVEPRPDDEVEEQKNEQLIEAADEAFGRQAPQEQKRESAGKVTEQSGAQPVSLRLGCSCRVVWRRVQRSASQLP
jgi:hypothetical protein